MQWQGGEEGGGLTTREHWPNATACACFLSHRRGGGLELEHQSSDPFVLVRAFESAFEDHLLCAC